MIRTHNTGDYWVPQDTKFPVAAVGALFRNRSEPSIEEDVQLTPSQTYGVVTQEDYMELSGNRVVLNTMGASNMKRVCPGDFIIHLRSFQGGIELSRVAGKVSNAYTVLEPSPLVDIEYFRWLLKSDVFITGLSSLTDQLRDGQSISFGTFSKLALPLPSLETQRRIADYLDHETGQIDETITRIDKVIELLEERQAVFIDSLLESSDYANASIELIANLENGDRGSSYPKTDEIKTEGVPFVNAGNINSGRVSIREAKYVSPEKYLSMGGAKLSSGDVLFCLRGSVGKTGIYEHYEGALASSLCSLRPDSTLIGSEFLYLNLAGGRIQGEVQATLTGSAQPNYGADQLASIKIPLPDLEEQERIVGLVNNEKKQNKIMMSTADRIKKLLSERRSALITAAVTGRIEV